MGNGRSYAELLQAFAGEMAANQALLAALPDDAWHRPTRLPNWDVLTLAAHLVFCADMVPNGVAAHADGPPDHARTTYYCYDRSVTSPLVDARTRAAAAGETPASLRAKLAEATATALRVARETDPAAIVAFRRGTIRLDDFMATRVLEACIHGLDLRAAIGAPPTPTPPALRATAVFLDDMLGGPRPTDLADDVAWVETATGRRSHPDPRLPLVQ